MTTPTLSGISVRGMGTEDRGRVLAGEENRLRFYGAATL
jgi:hypothetical protein